MNVDCAAATMGFSGDSSVVGIGTAKEVEVMGEIEVSPGNLVSALAWRAISERIISEAHRVSNQFL